MHTWNIGQQFACRYRRRAGGLAVVLGAGLGSVVSMSSAFGETAADGSNTGLEEIIVTSRKVAEDLQTVPIAVSAFTGADLEAAGVRDLRDLTFLTPGLTFTEGAGANYFSKPIIRGQTDIGGSADNNVPVFLDGIYISNTAAIDLGLIDLDRVEVIKGPVSATYGRSAYAGAINYVSAKPTDQMHGYIEGTVGDYDKQNLRGSISGPLIDGLLKGGISASYDRFDGTYRDDATGQHAGGYVKKDVLANLDITPNEHLEIRPVIYSGDDVYSASPTSFGPANCSVGLGYGYSQSFCGRVPNSTFEGPYIAPGGAYGQTGNSRHVFLSSLQIALTYGWGTLSSLTGYNVIHSNEYAEFDDQEYGTAQATYYLPAGATVGGFPTGANATSPTLGGVATGNTVLSPEHFGYTDKNRDFSEELRYRTPQDQPLRGSIGAYYASSYHYENLNLAQGTCAVPAGQYIIAPFATPCGQEYSGQQTTYSEDTKIYAGFVGGDWDVIKDLTLSTEIRFTDTQLTYNDLAAIYAPSPYACEGYSTSCASTANPIGAAALSKDFHDVTSRQSLSYKIVPDVMAYVSAANGEKVGGFNNNVNPALSTFQPETNWTYELGVKSTLFNRRLQLDADIFYIDAKNYQIYGPPPGATEPGSFITTNYGGLATRGVELSAAWLVVEGTKVLAGFSYADPKFKKDAYDFGDVTLCGGIPSCAGRIHNAPGTSIPAVSLYGLHPPYESNMTFNVALDLNYLVWKDWRWFGRVDYRYEDKQYYQYPIDTGYFGPKSIVNLKTGVSEGPFTVSLWLRNLTNDKTPETVQDAAVTGATNFQGGYFPVAVLPEGRTFGATFRYKF